MLRELMIWTLVGMLMALLISCKPKQMMVHQEDSEVITDRELYDQERAQLVQQDKSKNFSSDIILNEREIELDLLLKKIQRKQLDQYQSEHFFPPASDFYQSKKHIENNELYQIIKRMPKGGALHMHTLAMGDADWLIDKALDLPEMYVYWMEAEGESVIGQFQAFRESDVPEGYVQVQELIRTNPNARGQLHGYLTFDESISKDSVDIWKEFEYVFQRVTGILRYDPVFPDYMTHVCELLIQDNVQHTELRMPFRNYLYTLDKAPGSMPLSRFVRHLGHALDNAKELDPHFSMKVIHQNLRFRSGVAIEKDIREAIEMKKEYPNWIVGYDLVAEEDAGYPTSYHVDQFLELDQLEIEHQVQLPLFLHDGESNWASNDNLYDAILLGTERIGHGFNLFRYPSLIEKVIEEDICIEINPLSNQILGYIKDLRNHPASTYLRRGINCSISSDDPLIFDYQGLSYDYWSIYMAWELDLSALKKLSRNGIAYSALNVADKQVALNVWKTRWNTFISQSLDKLKGL